MEKSTHIESILIIFSSFYGKCEKNEQIAQIEGIIGVLHIFALTFSSFKSFKSFCGTFFGLWYVYFVPTEPPRASPMHPQTAWERTSHPRGSGNNGAISPANRPPCESRLEGYSVRVSA